MKICLTNKYRTWDVSTTGKGLFARRLLAELELLGVGVTTNPDDKVDIDMQITRENYWPKNAKKRVVRRGPVKYDTNMTWKEHNASDYEYMKKCHGIVYQSGFSKKLNDVFLAPPRDGQKWAIIPNGDSLDKYLPRDPKPFFLASTREWVWEKRLKDVIKSFLMADIPKEYKLYIAGIVWDTPKRFPPNQREFVKKYSSERVKFLGNVPEERLVVLLSQATALIHLVYIDAQPNAVAEAICAGCPVICTDQGGQAEIVRKCSAGLIIQDKPYDFKQKDRRGGLPEASRQLVARAMNVVISNGPEYDIDPTPVDIKTIARQYTEFFERVLA